MHVLLIAAAALAALAGAQPAGTAPSWIRVARGPQHATYLDVRSVRARGSIRSAWTRSDYDAPTRTGAMRTYFSQDVDCAARTLTMTEFVNHDRGGRVLSRAAIPPQTRRTNPVSAGTQGETLLNMVCN